MITLKKPNIFYSDKVESILYQGDVVDACGIGLKEIGNDSSPDFWLIITKSCDLSFDFTNTKKTRSQHISLIPLLSFKFLKRRYGTQFSFKGKVVLLGIYKLLKGFKGLKSNDQLNDIIKDKITRFMFLPPQIASTGYAVMK